MKLDELAFFNQQLGLMLKQGMPLEGSLRQLAAGLRDAGLRAELARLEDELSLGTPLAQALDGGKLPVFYRRMVQIGARGNDLPAMLQLLADHYQRTGVLWTRLKGLMVYPLLVILVAFGLTTLLSVIFSHFLADNHGGLVPNSDRMVLLLWVTPVLLGLLAVVATLVMVLPRARTWLRWRLPAFREASLAQLASTIALMLRGGTPLPEALAFAGSLEEGTPAAATLARWKERVAAGDGGPSQWSGDARPFPPLFMWLLRQRGEDVAGGFQNAANLYQSRAAHQSELLLYCALPVSVLLLGQVVFWQVAPVVQSMVQLLNALGD